MLREIFIQIKKIKLTTWFTIVLPFVVVNLFGILGLFFFFPRSIFYYEYALVLLTLWFYKKPWPSMLLFIGIFLFDVFGLFSSLFLFQLNEFLASVQFASLYHFSANQFILIALGILYLSTILYVLKRSQKAIKANGKAFLITFFFLYLVVYVIDFQSGYNIFNEIKQEQRKNDPNNDPKNLISSLFYDYYKDLSKAVSNKPVLLEEPSITFSTFSKDTTGNQMTIVIESWGAIKDTVIQHKFEKSLSKTINLHGYNIVNKGLTKYFGSTTAAGMRELTNTDGDYNYFINKKSDTTFTSIFNYKNKQGFETFAFHPFTGRMFSRSIWWKNLGPQHIYFRDNYVLDNPLSSKNIDEEAHFPSVKDEAFFDYINNQTKNSKKKFAYYLTVNSHLPYKHHVIDLFPDPSFNISALPISEEAQSQLIHIKNFIAYVAAHLAANHWDKVIIVGDHLPPFPGLQERRFYQEGKVPYLVIEKIK